jgi:hypothetical protein
MFDQLVLSLSWLLMLCVCMGMQQQAVPSAVDMTCVIVCVMLWVSGLAALGFPAAVESAGFIGLAIAGVVGEQGALELMQGSQLLNCCVLHGMHATESSWGSFLHLPVWYVLALRSKQQVGCGSLSDTPGWVDAPHFEYDMLAVAMGWNSQMASVQHTHTHLKQCSAHQPQHTWPSGSAWEPFEDKAGPLVQQAHYL